MPDSLTNPSFNLGAIQVDRDGPCGIQRGDLLYINEASHSYGLRAFETTRGVVAARTKPEDATHTLGRVCSLQRKVD